MKFSAYYFHMKTKTLADFQICISVPLKILRTTPCLSTAAQNLIGIQNIPVRLEALCIKSFYTPFHFI